MTWHPPAPPTAGWTTLRRKRSIDLQGEAAVAIETRIEGHPEAVRGVSHWLRSSLAVRVSDAATAIYSARNRADAGWQGPAGEAFRAKMSSCAQKTDELSSAAVSAAQHLDAYAAILERARDDMRYTRKCAAAAGLVVHGYTIEHPEPEPAASSEAPNAVSSPGSSHLHAARVTAYHAAEKEAEAARKIAKIGVDTLNNVWSDITQRWFLLLGDLTSGAAGTLAAKHSSVLGQQAQFLAAESARLLERARAAPSGTSPAQIYRDFDLGRAAAHQADDLTVAASDFDRNAAAWGLRAGTALAVAGIAYDIADGKPVAQAVVSGGVGFGASVAAGAAIGTLIPVPVVGTAVGAVGGAAVGVFASGAVDSLWQNGLGDVGGAIEAGMDAVGNAGQAAGGLAEDAWNAIF